MAGTCASWCWFLTHTRGAQSTCCPIVLSRGVYHATETAIPQPCMQYSGVYSFGSLVDSHLIPPPSIHCGSGSSFPGLVPPGDMDYSELVLGAKTSDFSVMIGYKVDHFACTWSVEHFVA